MTRTVKTSIIEKKFTNKTTGKEQTISINYAKVIDRLNVFRSDYPRSKILKQDGGRSNHFQSVYLERQR